MSRFGKISENGSNSQLSGGQLTALAIAVVFFFLFIVGRGAYNDYVVKNDIQQHGARQDAAVVRVYHEIHHHLKSGDDCYVIASYQIIPQGWNRPVTHSVRLGNCNANIPELDYVQQNHTLPIAYDVKNPFVSSLNFDDEVFREDTSGTLKRKMLILVCFAALGVAAVTALSFTR